jgi:hypothetical protein
MPATCEYAFVSVRRCSPLSTGVDGKVTAKLMVRSCEILRFWFGPIDAYHLLHAGSRTPTQNKSRCSVPLPHTTGGAIKGRDLEDGRGQLLVDATPPTRSSRHRIPRRASVFGEHDATRGPPAEHHRRVGRAALYTAVTTTAAAGGARDGCCVSTPRRDHRRMPAGPGRPVRPGGGETPR